MKGFLMTVAAVAAFGLGGAANAGVIATNSTYGAFDKSNGDRLFNVSTHGAIDDLNVTIDFAKCDDVAMGSVSGYCKGGQGHYPGEVEFKLTGTNGVSILLVQRGTYVGGLGTRAVVTFDDEAATKVGGIIQSGSYRPTNALGAFDGIDMFGAWTLNILDTAGGDPLEYFSGTLEFNGGAGAMPEPATASLLGLGLLGLAALRRRAHK